MNDNPWRVDDMARMQRERIQEEMREIRMVEAAQPHAARLNLAARLLLQLYVAAQNWLRRAKKPARAVEAGPQTHLHARSHAPKLV